MAPLPTSVRMTQHDAGTYEFLLEDALRFQGQANTEQGLPLAG